MLSTNVAETSLTVPGIRYVVDTGLARVKRYRYRGKVEQLQIEPISQASANQRAGRCGRVGPGICVRLYDEDDFAARPEFTEPEIRRTNLASVILQMTALRLGDVSSFPFVEPPADRNVRDGIALLEELGALDDGRLTRIGRQLARLPIDPRLGRMVLEAGTMGRGGEIYVFDMGKSIKILDLAKKMIWLSGLEPDRDIEIHFTGLREGEKLYEELLSNHENTLPTHNQKILIAKVQEYSYIEINKFIELFIDLVNDRNELKMVALMKELVPEYKSNYSRYEVLDSKRNG